MEIRGVGGGESKWGCGSVNGVGGELVFWSLNCL